VSATAPPPAGVEHAAPPDPGELVATTTPAEGATWSAATVAAADRGVVVAGRERIFAGLGVAASLPLPHGLEDESALHAVRTWLAGGGSPGAGAGADRGGGGPDGPAPGPVAVGAFAFDRGAPTSLVVPAVTWCRDVAGRTWRIDVRRRDGAGAQPAPEEDRDVSGSPVPSPPGTAAMASTPVGGPEPVALRAIPPGRGYADAVASAVADIRAGLLRKVVLARMVAVELPEPPVPSALLRALWGEEGIFSPFSVPTPGGRLLGASPELVISRLGRTVTSHAFAGTVPLSATGGDADAARLFDSAKDRAEHRLVVEEIVDALERRCVALTVPAEPTVVRLRSDARLGTLVRGTLTAAPGPGDTALALLALLHPTPAVGGVPRADALRRIAELEAAPRGYWAGAVGWTDGAGDGEWVLGIRSVELDGACVRVRAGAGIVEDSDPQAELAETTVKLRPVLDALWPGASALL
jgi:isochorismate synthase